MRWTPYIINVVLHHYARVGPFDHKHAPIYPSTIENLIREGILVEHEGNYTTTELGEALVSMWCSTPVPVIRYVDPRFPDSEASK